MSTPTRERGGLFSALVGLASPAVLPRAAWAGLFIRRGRAYDGTWVTVHARGALAVWLPFRARR